MTKCVRLFFQFKELQSFGLENVTQMRTTFNVYLDLCEGNYRSHNVKKMSCFFLLKTKQENLSLSLSLSLSFFLSSSYVPVDSNFFSKYLTFWQLEDGGMLNFMVVLTLTWPSYQVTLQERTREKQSYLCRALTTPVQTVFSNIFRI